MDEDIDCTPPEVRKKSLETSMELLPQKSVEKYNRQYDIYMEWCKRNKIIKHSENVLLAYFADMSKQYSPSTLWSYYSMIKATLSANNNVDISHYKKLTAFLKQKGKNYMPKKSKILSQEEILTFLLDAPDNVYLMMKICVVFGISGALRSEELLNLKVTDIEHKQTILIVHIRKTKTNKPRMFVITSEFEGKVKIIELFNKYLSLRPKKTTHDRLFISYRNERCSVQPVGIHTFGGIPSQVAKYLGLPQPLLYTGHCFRRSSATLFANAGGSKENLKRHGGWKSDTIAESYVEESVLNKTKIANTILGQTDNIPINATKNLSKIGNHSQTGISENCTEDFVNIDNNSEKFSIKTASSGISFYKPSNCSFTFNITNNK